MTWYQIKEIYHLRKLKKVKVTVCGKFDIHWKLAQSQISADLEEL